MGNNPVFAVTGKTSQFDILDFGFQLTLHNHRCSILYLLSRMSRNHGRCLRLAGLSEADPSTGRRRGHSGLQKPS